MTTQQGITPGTYVVQVGQTLWENLPQLLWGALLFTLVCIPASFLFTLGLFIPTLLVASITIGPAWTALLAFETRLLQGRVPRQYSLFDDFRQCWRQSALLSLLTIFPLLALITTLPALQTEPVAPIVWLGLAADLLGCAVMATLSFYAFPSLAQHPDQGVRACIRDALILAGRHPANSLGLLAIGILFSFCIAYISLALLLLLPTAYALFIAANYLLVLQKEAPT
ncbi:MAG: hypothetical protein F4047_15925 [Caldilineaceae bacterium SB0670_bin_27]|uniref:DUF624 domain-containing protein n=1 Tax=Caldilineaceae bacterium SB0664_bin_27 TaxID=2605260 RepID=A0A6B0YNT5_9CHLR|nr:hypothetical protein [Caldilineaceae bacterium SB0664_bin_27]MYJ79595.1 hypothetical protein [Caldilineaceae bacterium SB0670_bin_27]